MFLAGKKMRLILSIFIFLTTLVNIADNVMAQSIEISGTIERGIVCPRIRTADGRVFSLSKLDKSFERPGAKVRMIAKTISFSNCQQGRSLRVISVESIR